MRATLADSMQLVVAHPRDRDQTMAIGDIALLSSRTINEARFQYTRSRLSAPVNDVAGPAVNISGVANFGTATVSPTERTWTLLSLWITLPRNTVHTR